MIPEIKDSLKLLQWGIAEAVWPTRCVICDTPGALLCRACELSLPYLDQLLACPACGAPWGRSICCECNQQTLRWKGLERFPLEGCASATLLSPETKRIVTTFKDRGERELSETIARLMAQALPPSWRGDTAFVPIPARKNAVRERGSTMLRSSPAAFQSLPASLGLPCFGPCPDATSETLTPGKG